MKGIRLTRWLGLLAVVGFLGFALHRGHATLVQQRPMLPLSFNHQLHGRVNCLQCHHDYADRSPSSPTSERSCLLCHKTTPKLAQTIERDFHHLCRGCHLQQAKSEHIAGPISECKLCHPPRRDAGND